MGTTVIDAMYEDFSALIAVLENHGEVSLKSMVDSTFKKTLAISAASYFEDEIRKILLDIIGARSSHDELVVNFLRNKALERQYHTFFNWRGNNANSFFALFGDNFKEAASSDMQKDSTLAEAMRDFLSLGNTRNELAHLNFASFALDSTAEEIFQRYKNAFAFVSYLRAKLTSYGKPVSASDGLT